MRRSSPRSPGLPCRIALAAATLLPSLALGGCSLLGGSGPTPFPSPQATSTALPGETPTSVPVGAPGRITAENLQELAKVGEVAQDLAGELAWSPDGETLALSTIHGAGIYEALSLVKLRPLESDVTPASLAYSPDGRQVATGGRDLFQSPQDTVTLWNPSDGTKLETLLGHGDWINSLAYSPTGELIASGSDDLTVRLWQVSDRSELQILTGHREPVTSVAFSPDGQQLASGSLDGIVRLWQVPDGAAIGTLEAQELGVTSVEFSPDGLTLASASGDGSIRLWASDSATLLRTLSGHEQSVTRIDFSPDGRLLASAGWDGTLRFWSVEDGSLLRTIDAHADPVLSVGFSPDGRFVASTSLDGSLALWGLGARAGITPAPTITPVRDPEPHLPPGSKLAFAELHMLTATDGWAVGDELGRAGHVFRTADGGQTWIDVTPPQPREPRVGFERVATAAFYDAYTGWVVYHPPDFAGGPGALDVLQIWRTSDGGATWQGSQPQAPLDINEGPPLVTNAGSQGVWILAEFFVGVGQHGSTLLRSIDSGFTWEVMQVPPDSMLPCHRTGIAFADTDTGWMTSECPFELDGGVFVDATADGGATWQRIELEPQAGDPDFEQTYLICRTHSPKLFSAVEGIVVAECETTGRRLTSHLYRTDDGGASWRVSSYPGGRLQAIDRQTAWALSGQISLSVDGGSTWSLEKIVSWDGVFSFVDAELGWAIARSGQDVVLVQTTNGANSWAILEPVVAP